MKKVLLMGNPNVGKSALFSQMTGVTVKTSNYAGTTVTYTEGKWRLPPKSCAGSCGSCPGCSHALAEHTSEPRIVELVDVPGTYSLNPEAKSERIAVDMLTAGDVIINVVDATNLERNLILTTELAKLQKPMIVVLNMWDETQHMGIDIDINRLEELLGVPVVPTNGRSGRGVLEIGRRIDEATQLKIEVGDNPWQQVGHIVDEVQNLSHRHHTVRERLQDISMHPVFGLPIALGVLALLFEVVINLGGVLSGWIANLFTNLWLPLMYQLNDALQGIEWLRMILVGELINGVIELEGSMGVLTTGLFVPIGLVTPYLLLFYLFLGFLEDWGYLPRMAVLFDRFFHKIGLHGYSVIPLMLSTGCNIPGVLALRNLESRRERFITAAIACTAIPCMAQSAIIFRAVGQFGTIYVWLILLSLLTVIVLVGVTMDFFVKGETPSLIVEMPPYRVPGGKMQAKKLLSRLRGFFAEAVPLMMLGILLIQVLQLTGVLKYLFKIMEPVVSGLWGLPKETASAMLVGLIRKDAAVALLEPLSLTAPQMLTAVLALVLYFPCVATYTVLTREVGGKDLIYITLIMIVTAVVGAMVMNLMGQFLPPVGIILIEVCLVAIALTASRIRIKRTKENE